MKHETAKKMLAFAVCVLFIAVTLLSVTFVLMHTRHGHDHDGPGGNCATCTHLSVTGNLLNFLAITLTCKTFGSGRFSAVRSIPKAVDFHAALFTLVHQKIKLNN